MSTKVQITIIATLILAFAVGGVLIVETLSRQNAVKNKNLNLPEEAALEIKNPAHPHTVVPIGLDTDIQIPIFDEQELQAEIAKILGDSIIDYGIVLRNLNTSQEVTINKDIELPPASISKVPYAILVMREVEKDSITLQDTIPIEQHHYAYTSDALYFEELGTQLSFEKLLQSLLIDSDNTAMTILEDYFGGADTYNQKLEDIGLGGVTRLPHVTTASNVAAMWEGLYANKWLNKDSTNILYELMSQTKPQFSDRIVQGVMNDNPEAKIIHKIGQIINDDYGETYHDSGVVFTTESDLLIVIINNHELPQEAATKIQQITKAFVDLNKS